MDCEKTRNRSGSACSVERNGYFSFAVQAVVAVRGCLGRVNFD